MQLTLYNSLDDLPVSCRKPISPDPEHVPMPHFLVSPRLHEARRINEGGYTIDAGYAAVRFSELPEPCGEAEQIAYVCVGLRFVAFSVFPLLCDALPKDRHRRLCQKTAMHPDQASFTVGAFTHGGVSGIRVGTRTNPWCTLLLVAIVRSNVPGGAFSSITLMRNIKSSLHSDSRNDSACPNILLPCSKWQGGELWVQDPSGSVLLPNSGAVRGRLIPIEYPFTCFDASIPHATWDWVGCRIILIAYHVQGTARLTSDAASLLRKFGFNVLPERANTDPYEPHMQW